MAGDALALRLAGMARNLEPYYRKAKDQLSPRLIRKAIEDGAKVTAAYYLRRSTGAKRSTTGLNNYSTAMTRS